MLTPDSSMPGSSMYQRLLAKAAKSGAGLLSDVLMASRQAMRTEAQRVRVLIERDQLELSVKLMETNTTRMVELFPAVLLDVFERNAGPQPKPGERNSQRLHLEQLELMDHNQVQERVEWARMLQHVLLEAETSLPEFNSYVSALVGLDRVTPERNPLRPDAYVMALQQLLTQLRLPTQVRATWLFYLAKPLGKALNDAYLSWSRLLAEQQVRRVGFSVIRTPEAVVTPDPSRPSRPERAVWTPEYRQTVLTLERLRRLMVGNLDSTPDNPKEAFQRQFAREFESAAHAAPPQAGAVPTSGFAATLPAALDALQEMQQVDVVMQRMQQRPAQPHLRAGERASAAAVRDELTHSATAMSQVLSLEVVSVMVENLVKDSRLLAPLRKVIERLEPALLRLVILDPRFFIDKTHPARRLLQEISERGLAFASESDADFAPFLLSLQRHASPLAVLNIEGPEPFAAALERLLLEWDDPGVQASLANQINSVSAVLGYAEERNVLAARMTAKLLAIPGIRQVAPEVLEFISGPWVQVMAQAELKDIGKTDDPGGYKDLVNELLWSAQPELTRLDVTRLTRLVPRLLSGLREGLGLIGYPSAKTSVFFDVLMKLHHQAFRPATDAPPQEEHEGLADSLLGNQDQWVAPAEAKASGFMDFPEEVAPKAAPAPAVAQVTEPGEPVVLQLGAWVEVEVKGAWKRMQLSWISQHGSMYLFTSSKGKTQSMTQKFFDRLLAEGKLRVVSDQTSMVDAALDAVVETAMRNSIDGHSERT
jgi:hypothetical protein